MKPQDVEEGKYYRITMKDETLVYQIRVAYVMRKGIKGVYAPFKYFSFIQVTGVFPFRDILEIKEI